MWRSIPSEAAKASALLRLSIDRTALPTGLLPSVKAHCRVEFDRDDVYLTGVASRAIDLFERLTEWGVFGRTYLWSVTAADGSADGAAWRWLLPLAPVASIKADAGGVDVSAQYRIAAASPDMRGDAWMFRDTGEPDPMPAITLTAGYAAADQMPPGVLDFVLRCSALLYENREAALMPGADMMAYANSLLAGHWLPKA